MGDATAAANDVLSRIDPAFNRLKDCRHGRLLYNHHDLFIGRSLDLYGEYSEAEFHLFDELLNPGDGIVEVGANIGSLTVPLARKVGNTGGVFAFEPQRLCFQTLCANVALNSLINVWAYNVACGQTTGSVRVPMLNPSVDYNFGQLAVAGQQQGDFIACIPLDSFGIPKCRLLKVDVEGMELDVLRGATQLISRFQPAIYVENDRPEKSDELVRLIQSLNYELYWHRPALFNPNNFLNNPDNIFGTIVSLNMLCVPRSANPHIEGLEPVQRVG
jgi:FkbM family methyltransferase